MAEVAPHEGAEMTDKCQGEGGRFIVRNAVVRNAKVVADATRASEDDDSARALNKKCLSVSSHP